VSRVLKVTVERQYTRDVKVPLVAGDDELDHGWQCIPQPPTLDDEWEIFDNSKDRKTGWQRKRVIMIEGGEF
jgi:hypothetical protein